MSSSSAPMPPLSRRPKVAAKRSRPTPPTTCFFHEPSSYTQSRFIDLFAGVGEGNRAWGFLHIKSGKWKSFEDKGLATDQQMIDAIRDAVTNYNSFVYRSERALEFYNRRGDWILKVIVNAATGRVVTARPISGDDGDYTAQVNALAVEIAGFPAQLRNNISAIARRGGLQHMAMDFMKISK